MLQRPEHEYYMYHKALKTTPWRKIQKTFLYQKLIYPTEFELKTLNKLFLGGNFD